MSVHVSRVECTLYADMVHVEPATPDDWDMVELHAAYLEQEILRQVSQSVSPIHPVR